MSSKKTKERDFSKLLNKPLCSVLLVVYEDPSVKIKEIVSRLHISHSQVSQYLKLLSEETLVSCNFGKGKDEETRAVKRCFVTPKGENVASKLKAIIQLIAPEALPPGPDKPKNGILKPLPETMEQGLEPKPEPKKKTKRRRSNG